MSVHDTPEAEEPTVSVSFVRPGLAVAALALVAACGSSDGASSSAAGRPTTPATPSMTMPATAASAAGAEPVVHIKNFMFSAPSASLTAGATFMVVNDDSVPHTYETVTKGGFDSGSIKGGSSKEVTAPAAGTYALKCDFHPSMHGTLTVG